MRKLALFKAHPVELIQPLLEVGCLQKCSDMDQAAVAGQAIDGVLDSNFRTHGFHLSGERFLGARIRCLFKYFMCL